jgi:hypothetical protein
MKKTPEVLKANPIIRGSLFWKINKNQNYTNYKAILLIGHMIYITCKSVLLARNY